MNTQNPFQGNMKPPDMDKVRKAGRRYTPIIAGLVVLLVLAFNSIYTLNNGEEAVITRFGKHVNTEKTPGLKFKMPFAETKHIVDVAGVQRMEFGSTMRNGVYVDIPEEAIMLTSEESRESRSNGLVKADWVIQYRVKNSYDYLFKVQSPERTLHSVTQAAYRRVTAAYPLDAILTDRKDDMQREILRDLQDICDKYEMGILITAVQLQDASPPDEVRESFLDVTRALEDKIAKTNQAERYENEQLPLADGKAAAVKNEAEAYKNRRVNEALGVVARYNAILEEFKNQPDVMRTRLYLEMIREVLPRIEKVYFLEQNSGNLLEILHLGQ